PSIVKRRPVTAWLVEPIKPAEETTAVQRLINPTRVYTYRVGLFPSRSPMASEGADFNLPLFLVRTELQIAAGWPERKDDALRRMKSLSIEWIKPRVVCEYRVC